MQKLLILIHSWVKWGMMLDADWIYKKYDSK
jgi:hypothetical protein